MFSKVEEGSEGNGHRGEVTRSGWSVIETSTDVDNVRDNTGATLEETETGTVDEMGDVTLRKPDRELIGCKDTALT